MAHEPIARARWWTTRVALPVVLLFALAQWIGRSTLDRASLEPFFDAAHGQFRFRRDEFFDTVLHVGGRDAIVGATVLLSILAAVFWRREQRRHDARRLIYLVTCFGLTVAVAGLWKQLAGAVTPWNTTPFGGDRPWQALADARGWLALGSPGAHAASGFAWVSLYFVGASLRTRHRWLWLTPGLLLGLLFAVGQHVRGAHPPSHEPLSLAIAWTIAAATALAFRSRGWLTWSESDGAAETPDESSRERALPWLAAGSVALLGVAFYASDKITSDLEGRYHAVYEVFEVLELIGMVVAPSVGAWLLVEKIVALRAGAAMRASLEREQRLQLLGRLAASVAHEVRNPLQTMRLIIDEQRMDMPAFARHPLRDAFESCFERIDRAVDLVYRLARPESQDRQSADMCEVLRDSIADQQRAARDRVKFVWRARPEAAVVHASAGDARIVVDNLIRNAWQASPEGGAVTLDLADDGPSWSLRIENAGSLQPRDGADHTSGLGLGLAISRQIVGNAGGTLDIAEADRSVVTTLRLPREVAAR